MAVESEKVAYQREENNRLEIRIAKEEGIREELERRLALLEEENTQLKEAMEAYVQEQNIESSR